MALSSKIPGLWWSRFHFLSRFLGLTGIVAAAAGVGVAFLSDVLDRIFPAGFFNSWDGVQSSWRFVLATLKGESGDLTSRVAVGLVSAGLASTALAIVVELLSGAFKLTGRRSAFGLNAALQAMLAAVLLVGVNWFSFQRHVRMDWTRDLQFTLPREIQEQLKKLTDDTTIVVYQRHKTFGQLTDKPDAYDYAAERKVVEKVKDLVQQFRELGGRFRVEVLDVEEEGYSSRYKELTRNAKELADAIEAAPENSIFFHSAGKVQRLSFNEFFQLDKTASRNANHEKGNLILLDQGPESFARKVLNLDEKRPKVGILVIHEWLTTEGPPEFGLAGLKKTLAARGYDVRDIILKKWSEMAPPEPGVYTYEETKFDRLEEEQAGVEQEIKGLQEDIKEWTKLRDLWQKSSLEAITKQYARQLERARIKQVTEKMRQDQLKREIEPQLALRELILKQYREERDEILKEKSGLNVDLASEERRIADLKAKLERAVNDCDLLFIPRMTIRNLILGDRIPNRLYKLEEAQVSAIKDALKSGKPVLACFGPGNENPQDAMRMAQLGSSGPDELENLFGQLGIKMGRQTILYNVESKAFAERRSGFITLGAAVEVPGVEFGEPPATIGVKPRRTALPSRPNPLRTSMQIAANSRGQKTLDLHVQYPRPVYYEPEKEGPLAFEPEFMITSPATWNEEQPFPSRERTPRYEQPKPDDPDNGTINEKRRGPFPIGLAAEVTCPADWYTDKSAPKTVRVVALGHGGLFVGNELSPAKEELLLHSSNWLLGRDELLPRNEKVWSYPRVQLNDKEYTVWRWGTWLGLPMLFAYLGLVVVLRRRIR